MFCHKTKDHKGNDYYAHFGSLNYIKMHYINEPIVEVILIEDKNGEYYGWIDTGKDIPCMVWKSEVVFSVCFPYGYKVNEKEGKGKHVRLSIKENK